MKEKFLLMSLLLLYSCQNKIILKDYYILYNDGGGYYIMCKLACSNDPIVKNIAEVEWNDSLIIIKQNNNNYSLIKSNGKELLCCNNDYLIQNISVSYIDSLRKHNSFRQIQLED